MAKIEWENKRKTNLAKLELEKLFTPKRNKDQDLDWKNIVSSRASAFDQLTNDFIKKHGLPKTWEDLLFLLKHSDPHILTNVIHALIAKMEHAQKHEIDLSIGQMRILKLSAEDESLISLIDHFLAIANSKL